MKPAISMLYAEDDPQARELLEKLLSRKFPDLAVYAAADGEQGLALFHEHRPELVLTDIGMPRIDGIEMIKRIREINLDAYVIAITAYNDTRFSSELKSLRVNRTIFKPVDFKALLQLIEEAVEALS